MPAVTPRWWPRIIVMALLVTAAVWAGATIRLETELLALLPQGLASVRGLDGFQRQFASDREVILVADDTLPVAAREEAFRKLRPSLAALPGVESVTAPGEEWLHSAPQLAAWAIWNLPPAPFAKVIAALRAEAVQKRLTELPSVLAGALDAEELAMRQFDPLGLLAALSEGNATSQSAWTEQPVTALTITAARPLIAFQDCADFCNTIHAVVAGEPRLLLTGRPAFTAEISTQMRHDMILMVLVAVTLASAAFWAFYRALRPLGWILLGQFLALGVGLIAARLGAGSLNVISMGFGCILLGISMDYSILVYHHFASPFHADDAVWVRLRHGIWFSAATTARV
jgi:predicted RND superfamily exporter protein